MDERYDALVIGSGMGGLAAAALLARYRGWRVCVLERHSTAGGFTHTFRRPGGWEWDVGLHYVGDMMPGTLPRRMMDAVTGGHVAWERMTEPFDRVCYPGLEFAFGGDLARVRADLLERFPLERAGLDAYFRDVRRAGSAVIRALSEPFLPPPVRWIMRLAGLLPDWRRTATTGEHLARRIADPALRALLVSIWGDYGIPPAQSAFPLHATIIRHYQKGAWYPRGGAGVIASGAEQVIAASGGRIARRHAVTRILLENGRAAGVEAVTRSAGQDHTLRLEAPVVISDAGAVNTFRNLLPPEVGEAHARRFEAFGAPFDAVSVYLGLNGSPAVLGLRGENVWLYGDLDHDRAPLGSIEDEMVVPRLTYLSLPSLRSGDDRPHAAEIITFLPEGMFARWRDRPWKRRGADYEALKDRIADALLAVVERRFPGFAALVAYREVSTPLTVAHFTASPHGAIYGVAGTAERYRTIGLLGPHTKVPGLLLTGADAYVPGVVGALFAGAAAAGATFKHAGLPRLLARVVRDKQQPTERPAYAPQPAVSDAG